MSTAARMLPMIWVRFAVLLIFGIYVAYRQAWWLLVFAVVMMLLTISQLVVGHRARREEQEELRQ